MYIYKYIIFKTISVFQRQVLRVFFFLSCFIFFSSKAKSHKKKKDWVTFLYQTRTERIWRRFLERKVATWTLIVAVTTTLNLSLKNPSSAESSQRGLSWERDRKFFIFHIPSEFQKFSLKPGVKKAKAAMLLICIVQCLLLFNSYYLVWRNCKLEISQDTCMFSFVSEGFLSCNWNDCKPIKKSVSITHKCTIVYFLFFSVSVALQLIAHLVRGL